MKTIFAVVGTSMGAAVAAEQDHAVMHMGYTPVPWNCKRCHLNAKHYRSRRPQRRCAFCRRLRWA